MLSIPSSIRIFVCVVPVDMRRSFDSLAELVRSQMGEEPLSGHLYLFRNKGDTKLKILWWEDGGYALFYKRLEKGRFSLPANVGAGLEINATSLSMLLYGLDEKAIKKQARFQVGAPV